MAACKRCGCCCKGTHGVYIFPVDIKPIATFLNISTSRFLNEFCNCEYLSISTGSVKVYSLRHSGNACQFLLSTNLCSIYDVRPSQCRFAPYHFLCNKLLWEHIPCIDENLLQLNENSQVTEIEQRLIVELLEIGYNQFEKEW